MIKNAQLHPDARRRQLVFLRDKSVTSALQTALHTHKQRYKITRITLEVLEETATADGVIYFSPLIAGSGTPVVDTSTPPLTITFAASSPLAVGVYNYGPGELSGYSLPMTLAADKTYAFSGAQSTGAGSYVVSIDVEPLDDNPAGII